MIKKHVVWVCVRQSQRSLGSSRPPQNMPLVGIPDGHSVRPPPGSRWPLIPNFYELEAYSLLAEARLTRAIRLKKALQRLRHYIPEVEIDHFGVVHTIEPDVDVPVTQDDIDLLPDDSLLSLVGSSLDFGMLCTVDKAVRYWEFDTEVESKHDTFQHCVKSAIELFLFIESSCVDYRTLQTEIEADKRRRGEIVRYDSVGSSAPFLMSRKRLRAEATPVELQRLNRAREAMENAPLNYKTLVCNKHWFTAIHRSLQQPTRCKLSTGFLAAGRGTQWTVIRELKRRYVLALWKHAKSLALATDLAWFWYELGVKRAERRRIASNAHIHEMREEMASELETQGRVNVVLPLANN